MSLYQLLAGSYAHSIPWGQVFLFWGDERHVPPDHPDSNYRVANKALLSKVPVPMENVFRIHAEENATRAATDYEQTLKTFFQLKPGEVPRFDLYSLGWVPMDIRLLCSRDRLRLESKHGGWSPWTRRPNPVRVLH